MDFTWIYEEKYTKINVKCTLTQSQQSRYEKSKKWGGKIGCTGNRTMDLGLDRASAAGRVRRQFWIHAGQI